MSKPNNILLTAYGHWLATEATLALYNARDGVSEKQMNAAIEANTRAVWQVLHSPINGKFDVQALAKFVQAISLSESEQGGHIDNRAPAALTKLVCHLCDCE